MRAIRGALRSRQVSDREDLYLSIWRRLRLLAPRDREVCRFYRTISRRSYDQLGALNHSLVLRALFGGTKRSTFVNIFMICPRWLAGGSRPGSNSASNRGHLMAPRTT
jgi:hypothetical protein